MEPEPVLEEVYSVKEQVDFLGEELEVDLDLEVELGQEAGLDLEVEPVQEAGQDLEVELVQEAGLDLEVVQA